MFPVRIPVHLYVRRATEELPNSEKTRDFFADWIVVNFVMVSKHRDSFQMENFLSTTLLHGD